MSRTALYVRVSDNKLTAEGDRRQDIERQVEKLKAWAAAQGITIADEDVFRDDGLSAYKDDYNNRPAFVRLLREVRGHHYQRVLVEDLTRWSRKLEDGLRTLKEVGAAGCTVTSLHENEVEVTSADGWLRAAISLMMAEWASKIMSEKIKSGMKRRENDARHYCESCGKVHLGRHPKSCACVACRRKKGEGGK